MASWTAITFDVKMLFTRDMRVQDEAVKGSASDSRETTFSSGSTGLSLDLI
jgi:hypothetical protein